MTNSRKVVIKPQSIYTQKQQIVAQVIQLTTPIDASPTSKWRNLILQWAIAKLRCKKTQNSAKHTTE
jgi:hypothetical protein